MRDDEFFAFARERHQIYLDRAAGKPEPWTDDPILGTYRFTNVFRELDRTTVWFRENVRDRLSELSPYKQVLGTILFRTLNRISSGEILFTKGHICTNVPSGWSYLHDSSNVLRIGVSDMEDELRGALPSGPWVTGAFIVKTPDGMDKLAGALWIVEQARQRLPATLAAWDTLEPSQRSLERLHGLLSAYPYLGGFTTYEIVSDLRWMPILSEAPDIMTWAHAGPGAKRGINRILGRDKDAPLTQAKALMVMQDLVEAAQYVENWPHVWHKWEMREVEHTLCEWDKYERVRLGEGRPRGKFR